LIRLGSVSLHPRDISIHPALQEFAAIGPDIALLVEEPFLCVDEGFRLTKRRDIQVRKNVAQMLLR